MSRPSVRGVLIAAVVVGLGLAMFPGAAYAVDELDEGAITVSVTIAPLGPCASPGCSGDLPITGLEGAPVVIGGLGLLVAGGLAVSAGYWRSRKGCNAN